MVQHDPTWEEIGRNIQDIVDRAVGSQDYRKLNQTIRQVVDKVADMGTDVARRAAGSAPTPAPKPAPAAQNRSALYGRTGNMTAAGVLKIVGGGILAFLTMTWLTALSALNWFWGGMSTLLWILAVAGFGGGGWLIASGAKRLRWLNRFKTYRELLGDKTHCSLEKLARGVGKSIKQVRRELRSMIDCGLFRQGHLNKEQTILLVSDEAYRYFEQSRLQLEQQQLEQAAQAAKPARDPRVQAVLDRGNAFIGQIRAGNDAIPGAEISEKISRMETLVRRIFQRAEAHPEVIPDLKKLMDYYLPMTVKLLNAYADMDAQPVQGENILASKREIEQTLDTLNGAFEKLLDDLFADTALDVSSDISVLQTLLAQEGLTEDGLSKPNNE